MILTKKGLAFSRATILPTQNSPDTQHIWWLLDFNCHDDVLDIKGYFHTSEIFQIAGETLSPDILVNLYFTQVKHKYYFRISKCSNDS